MSHEDSDKERAAKANSQTPGERTNTSGTKDRLSTLVEQQQARISELEKQLDYFKKRFVAARQAVRWFESRMGFRPQDSYGT